MRIPGTLLSLLAGALAPTFASGAAADTLYLESIPESILVDSSWEIVRHSEGEVGFVGMRFSVEDPLELSRSSANVFHWMGSSGRFFMGIEALSDGSDVPDFVLDDDAGSLLAYAEADGAETAGAELSFPMNVTLGAGDYALLLGCAEPDCFGGLPFGEYGVPALIPGEDLLYSYGTTSEQSWSSPGGLNTFRLALHAVPEPGSALLLATGLAGLGLAAGRRPRSGAPG